MEKLIIGIDIGGTKIQLALFTQNAKRIDTLVFPTQVRQGSESAINKIIENISFLLDKYRLKPINIESINIGAPGPVNYRTGVILQPPNLPTWRNVPLKKILEEKFNGRVNLDNDANVAALGELYFGAGKDCNSLVYITISTGVGGGIIINRKLYRGWNNIAGEVGHFTIDPSGPRCSCGQIGCLEVFISGPNLVKSLKEKLKYSRDEVFEKVVGKKSGDFSAKNIFDAAGRGSRLANETLEGAVKYLALGISIINYIVNPEKFILGGGVVQSENAEELLIQPTVERLRKICHFKTFSTPIVKARLGKDSVIWGTYVLGESK